MRVCNRFLNAKYNLPLFGLSSNLVRKKTSCAKPSAKKDKFEITQRFQEIKQSIWEVYANLNLKYQPVNLGQGFPNYAAAPSHVVDALIVAAASENPLMMQYTRGHGHMRLANALAKLYSRLIDHEIIPATEIVIAVGASGALFYTMMGHVNEGDEVIIIEPFYDCYEPIVLAAGGVPVFIPLQYKPASDVSRSSDFVLDFDELTKAFNSNTKAILVNTPHNPTGKVFTCEEIERICCLCHKYDVLYISDEVYEWMIYEPNEHIRVASLPGMWKRTITIGSAGKTFSVTGWKLGWAYGPAELMHNLRIAHQVSNNSCATPLQEALAIGIEIEIDRFDDDSSYFKQLVCDLTAKKDYLCGAIGDCGFKPIFPDGGYFCFADWSPLESEIDLSGEKDPEKDVRFTKWLVKNIGVLAIPPSAFMSQCHKSLVDKFARFCFIKEDETLKNAIELLKKLKKC